MSIEAIAWVLERADIPSPSPTGIPSAPSLSMVLLGLANHADRRGEDAYPSVRTLSRYARISERQVQRCLSALLELGLIERGNQRIVEAKIEREDRRPVVYNLLIERGVSSSPRPQKPQIERGDNSSPRSERGDKSAPNGVTGASERGDTHVTQTVLEPKDDPAAARIAPDDEAAVRLAELEVATRAAGLGARFDSLSAAQRGTVDALIVVHGTEVLVREARRLHRPDDPARYVSAWIPSWLALPAEGGGSTRTSVTRCGKCVNWWIEDPVTGRPIRRCTCRSAAVTA
ncbi:helix-turn-helix domain-containing protein [Prescottella agglutinans]|uniref:Helix-turn-helix domain-containing protein n=1 Tax=Prescottella agglutinans TaxID=1644129 RepID=A0ABT6MHH5_9NOCA|nr:helix-turn-helix domain-containing protein [Prescottella agglutinans]MDH6283251.1 hypothetical protein [Prescottella agglutinans]